MSQIIKINKKVKAIGVFDEVMKQKGFVKESDHVYTKGTEWTKLIVDGKTGEVSYDSLSKSEINELMVSYSRAIIIREASLRGKSVVEKKTSKGIEIELR